MRPLSLMIARWQRHWHDFWAGYTHRQQTAATVAAVLLALGLILWPLVQFWGLPRLKAWRVDRTMQQAAGFHAAGDYRNLLISIRRASQLGSRDLAVWRNIAGYLTELGAPDALRARETVIRLAPADDLAAQVELAETALLFGDYKTSQAALQAASAVADSDAAYQQAAATLALYLGDIAEMKRNLAALVAADPDNLAAAYDLAAARLWSHHADERQLGIDALLDLLPHPAHRVQAALELLKDAARTQDNARFDRILPLILGALDYPPDTTTAARDLPRLLLGLKTTAKSNPTDVARVAEWMAEIRLGRDALPWIHSLPSTVSAHPAVREVAAEIAIRENIASATSYYLLENALGQLPAEAAILAAGAHQLEANNRLAAAQAAWDEAVQVAAASRHPEALRVLARVSTLWDRREWTEKALRAALRRSPEAFWAYAALRDQLIQRDSANELWELYQQWIVRQPDNLTVVIQWLRLGLTLPFTRSEVRQRAPALLQALPRSPRLAAALAAWHWEKGELDTARQHLALAGESLDHEPDAAYWAALIEQPLRPNDAYPALARLPLLSAERERLTRDLDVPAGLPRSASPRELPSLRVR